MQVVAQLASGAENAHINNGDLGTLCNSRSNDSRQRIVESLDVVVEPGLLRLDNLGHNDNSIGLCLEHIVEQLSKSRRRLSVWFGRRVTSVQVVRSGMEQDNVGLECKTSGSDTADLADCVSRETLVVLVGHGAGLLGTNEVDGVSCRLYVCEKSLAVTVRTATVDVAPSDGVSKGQDA
jgi:hypothetical protein